MSGQSGSAGTLRRGTVVALGLSIGFLGLAVLVSPVVAAAVAVPVALVVSVFRTRAVSRTAHVLEPTHFEASAVVTAPRASEAVGAQAVDARAASGSSITAA